MAALKISLVKRGSVSIALCSIKPLFYVITNAVHGSEYHQSPVCDIYPGVRAQTCCWSVTRSWGRLSPAAASALCWE